MANRNKDTRQNKSFKQQKPNNENIKKSNAYVAHAPYNFVPLNTSVIDADQILPQDKYHSGRFSGHIDCELETLTPLYVRGTLADDEIKKGMEAKDKSDFFSPAGKVRIPGSSIRGMVRNLVEIVSWSRFGFFEDKNLYYRSFADISSLRNEYINTINPKDEKTGKSIYKMSAGYLVKIGFEYAIFPAEGKQFEKISKSDAMALVKKNGQVYSEFNYYRLHDGRYVIVSGSMPRKKDWIIYKINRTPEKKINIPEIDIRSYEMDENRSDKVPNLLELCEKYPEVPCFYIVWKDKNGKHRISFGHTGLFRIAYRKPIREHLPSVHDADNNTNRIDFAHAIFGNTAKESKDSFAGRVFFEDAQLVNPNINPFMDEKVPKVLLGPKPTTFQHYLEQDSMNPKNLKHYNSETWIRGNKFYWHKSGTKWEKENQKDFNKKIETKIKPVKPKTLFRFRIRYENLTENELGALLFTLYLPVGCGHKIGMGKPLGLGSVKINPELFIIDREKRYSALFDNFGWVLAETKINEEDTKKITAAFEEHILKNMDSRDRGNASSLWDTYRLKQLKLLLDIERGKNLEVSGKTEYMNLKDFRYRNVLPVSEKV
ncbi:MAG: TIGR03986 family CRISPR-associated RAMP protein [Candidatus Methanoperedens sp.]|nr:TIGR03986 family CRISPR-associated RAMP protein [Candidatus Methanoperedens sp.]